jgi:hypothetical protein
MEIRDLGLWDGSAALLVDGGTSPPRRPVVHLQAASTGLLRLVGANGPLLWGLVESGWWSVDIVRAATASHTLAPIRVDEAESAPGDAGSREHTSWWTRRFAEQLCASTNTPLARGRQSVLAPMSSIASAPASDSIADWHRHRWEHIALRPSDLDALREQRDSFELDWDHDYLGVLLTRPLSDDEDGRVKSWRKRARERRLPPILVWWCRGLYSHVVLDGHDRLLASLLEGISPVCVVLADVTAHAANDVDARRERALHAAGHLTTIASVASRADTTNSVLRAAWDPRTEWDLATPGFALDVDQWRDEVRDTRLAMLAAERARQR